MRRDNPDMVVSSTTTHHWFKKLHGKRKKQWVHPSLSNQQKFNRVQFIETKINENGEFNPQFGVVHVNEAWFYRIHNTWIRYFPGDCSARAFQDTLSKFPFFELQLALSSA